MGRGLDNGKIVLIGRPAPELPGMKRLYALDALRGLAALAVVVWHWHHFYAIDGHWPHNLQLQAMPFFAVLKPLYTQGLVAVDLFFALSGFVFFWLYGDAIAQNRMSGKKFAKLRFSRLFPLHFVALIAVALMQMAFWNMTERQFVFEANDGLHFLLNLFLVQQWLPPVKGGLSFNGPAWSISVEVLLYVIFFVCMRGGLTRLWHLFFIVAVGVTMFNFNNPVASGMIGFFTGGIAYRATKAIAKREDAAKLARYICAAAIFAWVLVAIETYIGPFDSQLRAFAAGFTDPKAQKFAGDIVLLSFLLIVCPLTLMALALHERVLGASYRRLSFLGDISYAVYMLHFPLQLALALLAVRYGFSGAIFNSGWVMLSFFAGLIGLAALSYRHFEQPLQDLLRGRIRKIAPTVRAAA